MFWAFILLCFSVGPPYCLHMRVKFYSSEPNNLHEELTRWIEKHTFGLFSLYLKEFYGWIMLVFTDQWNVLSLLYAVKLPTFFILHFHSFRLSFRYLFVLQLKQDVLSGKWVFSLLYLMALNVFSKTLLSEMLYSLGNSRFFKGWICFQSTCFISALCSSTVTFWGMGNTVVTNCRSSE